MTDATKPPGWAHWEGQLEHIQERYEAGNFLALFDALIACQKAQCVMPDWLAGALKDFLVASLKRELPRKDGRSGNALAQSRDLFVHSARYKEVWTIRQYQKNNDFLMLSRRAKILAIAGKFEEFKKNWDDAYKMASLALRGTFAQSTPRQMKDSYIKIAKMMKTGSLIELYLRIAFDETREAFDLNIPDDAKPLELPSDIIKKNRDG